MKKSNIYAVLVIGLFPALASAQSGRTAILIDYASTIVDSLVLLAAAVALLVFFWGLAKFIFKVGGDEKATADGKRLMIWGVIALFVMISVWGLVRFVQGELLTGIDTTNPTLPGFSN